MIQDASFILSLATTLSWPIWSSKTKQFAVSTEGRGKEKGFGRCGRTQRRTTKAPQKALIKDLILINLFLGNLTMV